MVWVEQSHYQLSYVRWWLGTHPRNKYSLSHQKKSPRISLHLQFWDVLYMGMDFSCCKKAVSIKAQRLGDEALAS
eukprot:1158615-Pelagomonas_calceolata.AAC.5